MTDPILVCPFEPHLIAGIENRALVVRVDHPLDVVRAAASVRQRNILHAVRLESRIPLAFVPFEAYWSDIPLAVYAPGLGELKIVANQLKLLRNLNVRIFLPAGQNENLTAVRILASLQVAAGLSFDGEAPDWDALSDLMHYAVYSRVAHAPIEPFHYLANHYQVNGPTDFGPVYFEGPPRYLHLDGAGRVALSAGDLDRGIHISDNLEILDRLEESPSYRERQTAWQRFFLQADGCAFCQGWRVCLGKFSAVTQDREACGRFFGEVMEAAEYWQKTRKGRRRLWQP